MCLINSSSAPQWTPRWDLRSEHRGSIKVTYSFVFNPETLWNETDGAHGDANYKRVQWRTHTHLKSKRTYNSASLLTDLLRTFVDLSNSPIQKMFPWIQRPRWRIYLFPAMAPGGVLHLGSSFSVGWSATHHKWGYGEKWRHLEVPPMSGFANKLNILQIIKAFHWTAQHVAYHLKHLIYR